LDVEPLLDDPDPEVARDAFLEFAKASDPEIGQAARKFAPDRLRAWHRPAGLSVEIEGTPVDAGRASTLVVMNGQYLRGLDLSPRGHPGDGVVEAQLYALPPGARRAMRTRLSTGAHVPHPAITIRRAHHVVVRAPRPVPVEIDGTAAAQVTTFDITLRPAAYHLLV
jgi:diacylglycerol kinase family enzyme